MQALKNLENIDKPREKLQKLGCEALKNYELMAVLIGTGVKGKDVISLSKELVKLLEKGFDTLNLENTDITI